MRRVLILGLIALAPALVCAQDFVTIFMDELKSDTSVTCITISPRMMEEILNSQSAMNEDVVEIISGLKSMQIVTSSAEGGLYYDKAVEALKKNAGRYEPYVSFNSEGEDYQIMVRKRKDAIVEMIMLVYRENQFAVINFTGNIKPGFISTLAESVSHTHLH